MSVWRYCIMVSESTVGDSIKEYVLSHKNSFIVKYHVSALSSNGFPDYIGALDGKPFIIETKIVGGKPRKNQIAWGKIIQRTNYVYGVVHSLDEFKELFSD